MTRRIWAAALTALAVIAVFLVLAHGQRASGTAQVARTASAGTTHSSPSAGGSAQPSAPSGASPPTTRTS